jgi:hypothetical protein
MVLESIAGFIRRTVVETRLSNSTRSLAVCTAGTTWPMAGNGMNTSSVIFILVAKILQLLFTTQTDHFAGIDWLYGCGTKSATINLINDVETVGDLDYSGKFYFCFHYVTDVCITKNI